MCLRYNRGCKISSILGLISFLAIIFIKFDIFCYIPDIFNIGETVNELLLGLALSIFSAAIFYLMIDVYPEIKKWKFCRNYVTSNLRSIHESIRWNVDMIQPFKFEPKQYTEEEFTNLFIKKDFFDSDNKIYKNGIDSKRLYIIEICEKLMGSYISYITNKELRYLRTVIDSYYIRYKLEPIDYSLPEDILVAYPNNQEEIGRCIFKLYSTKLPSSAIQIRVKDKAVIPDDIDSLTSQR